MAHILTHIFGLLYPHAKTRYIIYTSQVLALASSAVAGQDYEANKTENSYQTAAYPSKIPRICFRNMQIPGDIAVSACASQGFGGIMSSLGMVGAAIHNSMVKKIPHRAMIFPKHLLPVSPKGDVKLASASKKGSIE